MLWILVVAYFGVPAIFPALVLTKQLLKGDVI